MLVIMIKVILIIPLISLFKEITHRSESLVSVCKNSNFCFNNLSSEK